MDLLVVGLGNPGMEYARTRHNIGFDLVDELARRCNGTPWKKKWQGVESTALYQEKKIVFLKPQIFMNRSGQSVARYQNFFKIHGERFLVLHDDLDMPVARIKLVRGGGDGGHNGIKSLVSCLGFKDFFRLKIGIGRPGQGDVHPGFPVEKYVLSNFTQEEITLLEERMDPIFSGFREFVQGDISKATGIFNSLKVG